MTIWQAIVLGLVQGVTEFLPISSSGFLVLIPELLGWELQSVYFDGIVHLATLFAIVVALWPEIKEVIQRQTQVMWWLGLGTVPVLVAGYVIQEVWDISFRSLEIVAWSFVVWGIVLFLADRFSMQKRDGIARVGWQRALAIGLAQAIALIPGTSRSGITITAGLFSGLSRQTATTFSFLMSIPIIVIAGLLSLKEAIDAPQTIRLLPVLIGGVTAFISALLTVRWLRAWLGKRTYQPLAILRVVIGLCLLLLVR